MFTKRAVESIAAEVIILGIAGILFLPGHGTAAQTEQAAQRNAEETSVTDANNVADRMGYWSTVDYVKEVDDFKPNEQSYKRPFMLLGLNFTAPSRVNLLLKNNLIKETTFSEDTLMMPQGYAVNHFIKTIDGTDYLFVEWMTPDTRRAAGKPDYYVLVQQSPDMVPAANASPVGRWEAVDFVRNIEDFKPGEKQYDGDLFLKNMTFFKNGTTAGPWTWKDDQLWHPGDRSNAKLAIYTIHNTDYLFMEWVNGDVITGGQKPSYYVFRRGK
jgi:bla regulator protein BlaR1